MRWKTKKEQLWWEHQEFCLGHAKFERPMKVWKSVKKSR